MKQYLIASRPKMTIWFTLIILFTSILFLFIQPLNQIAILNPSDLREPLHWYKLITYPFASAGLLNWIINALALILMGYIIENRFPRKDVLTIMILSSVLGGLIFILFNQNDVYDRGIASPTMISWGYWATTIIIGLKFWKKLNIFEKIIMILCLLSLSSLFFQNLGFLFGKIAVIVCIIPFTLLKIKKN